MLSSLLKLSIAICFLAVLLPLPLASGSTCPEEATTRMPMLSEIGTKLLEYAVDEVFPTQMYTDMTRELDEMNFQETVCSYFEHYHRFYWRLRHLQSQNNTEHKANTSLLTFLLKKSTKSMCTQFRTACAGRGICSNLDCNINSIATLCLGLPTKAQLVDFLQPPVQLPTEGRHTLVQLWMQMNLSSNNLRDGLFDSLANMLEDVIFIRCTVPSNGTTTVEAVEQIRCCFAV